MTQTAYKMIGFPGSTALGQLVRMVGRLAKALQHRREIKSLAEFDDRMLKDIGLMRGDVDSALAVPLFHNPSLVLVRSAERHTRAERLAPVHRRLRPSVPVVARS